MKQKKYAEIQIVNITNITNITTLPILSIMLTLPNHQYYQDMNKFRAIFDVIVQISNITALLLLKCARIEPLLGGRGRLILHKRKIHQSAKLIQNLVSDY